MALELPDLPYAHDALASSGMSQETLEFHHDLHHKAYVDNGNKLLSGSGLESVPLEEIVRQTYGDESKAGIFNNASQHWNHIQFWEMMKPGGSGARPAELESRINDSFGSFDAFRQAFVQAGVGQFGSGWCWLVSEGDGLKVTKTPNGVNPICFQGQTALLGCDVWEHSYYIDFRNKRPAYLENFIDNLVNWEDVAARLPDS